MVRPLRIEFPGAFYHVTSRGNARLPIFKDTQDRENFLNIFKETVRRFRWICHAYCLMNNHYHLLVETTNGNLSKGMRHLNGVYTQRLNRRHNRVGHVFQGRFKSILVQQDNYFLELSRYVVLNPVRAGLSKNPEEYIWSSYCATAGLSKVPSFLEVNRILFQFDGKRLEAQNLYKHFVKNGVKSPSPWKKLRGQIVLGDKKFIQSIKASLKDKSKLKEIPKRERLFDRPSLNTLLNVSIEENNKNKRNRALAIAYFQYGYTFSEIGKFLGLHYSTISKIINKSGGSGLLKSCCLLFFFQ